MNFYYLKQIYLLLLFVSRFQEGKLGSTASKAGLAGITQFGSSSSNFRSSTDNLDSRSILSAKHANLSALRYLKFNLFQSQGYDKAVRPVQNKTDILLVSIDITYMQVLNLNEKEQTLTSLLRYRLYWKDYFLSWNPDEYDGITDIWLPASTIWMPDIVCYEETGSRDFNPRIPFVVVHFDGKVRYLEPTAYQTSCAIRIAYFPFDEQTCTLTFGSWTIPSNKLDLLAARSVEVIRGDIDRYFINSGEWNLFFLNVTKFSESFSTVLTDDNSSERNMTKEEKELAAVHIYYMEPESKVADVASARTSDLHWSYVRYTLKFRRSSSLYVQSMLFPALLLTTISVLGFYLPPESGERIGLQITILLTFMVFILTVGDMFPASTGPYLGVYFVLCMALLGLNIIMTVLVLHLHHIPCKLILITDPLTGESKCNMKILPWWIKLGLLLTGVYQDMKNFAIPAVKLNDKTSTENKATSLSNILRKWRGRSQSRLGEKKKIFPATISSDFKFLHRPESDSKTVPEVEWKLGNGFLENLREKNSANKPAGKYDFFPTTESNGSAVKQNLPNNIRQSKNWRENASLLHDMSKELSGMSKDLASLSDHFKSCAWATKNRDSEIAMEEKWKSVARKVDFHCMFAYVLLMVFFHAVIALVIALGA